MHIQAMEHTYVHCTDPMHVDQPTNHPSAHTHREFADSFPDVKREVCLTVEVLARRSPKDLRLHQTPILQVCF
jgi:hypothetical protein